MIKVGTRGAAQAVSAGNGGSRLPCLHCSNSIENTGNASEEVVFGGHYQKSVCALEMNVQGLIDAKGIKNCAFVTLTFPDHVTCPREASRRFNSLNTNFLKQYVDAYIGVYELQKNGRIHFHFVVHLGFDCKTGYDFEAVANRRYSSVPARLRALWKAWRENLHKYGFGRFEVAPIKGNSTGIAKYLAKYVGKSLLEKKPEHKGFRLVRSSLKGAAAWKVANTSFAFNSTGSFKWRMGLKQWFHSIKDYLRESLLSQGLIYYRNEFDSSNHAEFLHLVFGAKWAFLNRENIILFSRLFLNPQPQAA